MSIFSSKKLKQQEKQEEAEAGIKKYTVLLVDDEQANLDVMASLLNQSCHILTALNGPLALEVIAELGDKELSMVISDQRMPLMSGVELLEKIAVLRPDTLRLVVSGYCEMNAVLEAINKAKIYHFFTKPFEPADFLATVEQALTTYELKQSMESQINSLQQQLKSYKQSQASTKKIMEDGLSNG
ncbi:MAG: response regulator RpfG family c-di-GMP phosphodiesterase [Phenylobacterium sp.]|jgi:response regulator RpfG family c-di-GMP phosphodiesterase